MKFYTYAHIRNDTGLIFYIGKGSGRRAFDRHGRSDYWKRIADKHGYRVEILARWCDEADAYEQERLLIECFKSMGYELCNMTDGGDGWTGVSHTQEAREKIGSVHKGKVPWWVIKNTQAPSTKDMRFSRSEQTKERISNARKGVPMSAETKKKLSAAAKARWAKATSTVV
jgi:hypothetical protein